MDTVISVIEFFDLGGLFLLFIAVPWATIFLYKQFSRLSKTTKEHYDLAKITLEIQKNTCTLLLKCPKLDLTTAERNDIRGNITKLERKIQEFKE